MKFWGWTYNFFTLHNYFIFFHNNNELFTNSKKVQSVHIETAYTNSPSTSHTQKLMTTVTMSWNKIHQNKFNMDQQLYTAARKHKWDEAVRLIIFTSYFI